jgi:hypothetical protein
VLVCPNVVGLYLSLFLSLIAACVASCTVQALGESAMISNDAVEWTTRSSYSQFYRSCV